MRLLQYNKDGDFSLAEFFEGDIPTEYAILSHRWGVEEVTFADLTDGTGKSKLAMASYGSAENRPRAKLAITRYGSAENRLGVTQAE